MSSACEITQQLFSCRTPDSPSIPRQAAFVNLVGREYTEGLVETVFCLENSSSGVLCLVTKEGRLQAKSLSLIPKGGFSGMSWMPKQLRAAAAARRGCRAVALSEHESVTEGILHRIRGRGSKDQRQFKMEAPFASLGLSFPICTYGLC